MVCNLIMLVVFFNYILEIFTRDFKVDSNRLGTSRDYNVEISCDELSVDCALFFERNIAELILFVN